MGSYGGTLGFMSLADGQSLHCPHPRQWWKIVSKCVFIPCQKTTSVQGTGIQMGDSMRHRPPRVPATEGDYEIYAFCVKMLLAVFQP